MRQLLFTIFIFMAFFSYSQNKGGKTFHIVESRVSFLQADTFNFGKWEKREMQIVISGGYLRLVDAGQVTTYTFGEEITDQISQVKGSEQRGWVIREKYGLKSAFFIDKVRKEGKPVRLTIVHTGGKRIDDYHSDYTTDGK